MQIDSRSSCIESSNPDPSPSNEQPAHASPLLHMLTYVTRFIHASALVETTQCPKQTRTTKVAELARTSIIDLLGHFRRSWLSLPKIFSVREVVSASRRSELRNIRLQAHARRSGSSRGCACFRHLITCQTSRSGSSPPGSWRRAVVPFAKLSV